MGGVIAPQDRTEPNAGRGSDLNVADQDSSGREERIVRYLGPNAIEGE